jgi:hypothetical protein
MATDLEELVPSLRRMVNPPGSELLPGVTDGVLVGYLSDAFWLGRLDGFFGGYTESDGLVSPVSGDTELPRDWQQLIVFYAGMQIVENELRAKNTQFRVQAGPVEYEVQNSAQLLREHLVALHRRRDYLLDLLSSKYNITPGYIDMICARTSNIAETMRGFDSGFSF